MGAIARNAANNITTAGVFTADAITNASVTGITVLANAEDGITLISSQTANNSASLSFTTGIDSTYKAYKFVFIDIHPRTDNVSFTFQGSTNSGSTYNTTVTTTFFETIHNEADTLAQLGYLSANDLAQSTNYINILIGLGSDADQNGSGLLSLFNPSSTTYVKHFISRGSRATYDNFSSEQNLAGYFNTTSAINAIQFKMASGNFDGTIYLYGIK
jgi:hypothetical protein